MSFARPPWVDGCVAVESRPGRCVVGGIRVFVLYARLLAREDSEQTDPDQRDHIGRATSGTWSPVMKKYVVIGRVKPQYAKIGTRIYVEQTVEARRYAVPATVVKMPFFDPPRKRE